MAGHGCPPFRCRMPCCARSRCRLARGLALVGLLWFASALRGEDIDLELRASWGGGPAKSWSGSIAISAGELELKRVLGLEADAPGVVVPVDASTIRVVPRTPRTYDGIDLHVRAPRDALLRINFTSPGGRATPAAFEAKLSELVDGRVMRDLDSEGNRFAIHRTPGDTLRLETERDHLVFTAGESFAGKIVPNMASGAGTTAKCSLRVVSSTTHAAVWQQDHDVTLDERGSAVGLEFDIPLPEEEGVYELVAEMHSKKFSGLIRSKPYAERQVQFVVLRPDHAESEDQPWASVGEFDPAQPKLWERMLRLPSMKMVPGLSKGPLGSEPTGTREHQGVTWSTLKGEGWQAYPLPVANPGQPHLLEIEFPADIAQSVAISIVEPNAAGLITPLGLDSGVDVSSIAGRAPAPLVHRLPFWPRTKSPLVLLVNRSSEEPALFGKVRVSAGPTSLAATASGPGELSSERLAAAYFDKPLFPENFSVSDAVDAKSVRPIDDWTVYLQGGSRLADYLHFAGHNAAVVSVLCEGSSLYPSECLAPTPKYDMGAFSSVGNDPVRKDVLELLLRLFNRERLQLIPAVQFSSPLPELELLLATGTPAETTGIELLGPDGQPWLAANPTPRGMAPYYNVLDPRVQQAMRRVVAEIAHRYSNHPSLAGIAIQLSADGFAQLPDDACGLDDVTLARFASDVSLRVPPPDPRRPTLRWDWIQRNAGDAWRKWRAAQVAAFYADMQSDLDAVRPGLKLVLCPTDSLHSRRVARGVQPALPPQDRVAAGLLQVGLDAQQLSSVGGLTLARPRFTESAPVKGGDTLRAGLNHSAQFDQVASLFPTQAALHFTEPLPLRLEAFDKVSPFGQQNTYMFLLSHLSPAGPEARRRFTHSLAAADPHLVLDGGQMLSLGQEDEIRPLLHTLRQLPARPFETVAPSSDDVRSQPVVFRRWSSDDATWFYLVNDSPWPVITDVDLASSWSLAGRTLGLDPQPFSLTASQGLAHWKVRMEPYSLVAAKIGKPNLEVQDWRTQVDRAVDVALREQIRDVRLRANMLRSPTPLTALGNDSFEKAPTVRGETASRIPHWTVAAGPGITAELDHRIARRGGSSLHIASRSVGSGEPAPVVWVRSEPIPVPTTGRLALSVWLKVADAERQPKLRLAIEGRLHGQPYYRRANVGASEDGRPTTPLPAEWSAEPFLFPLDDLPTEGLTDLQVGFDLMGEGEIWIDDVQLYDLWFQEIERDSLVKSIALADFHVQEGQVADALHFLEGYWPQFLRRHVPLDTARLATLPEPATPAPGANTPIPAPAAAPARSSGMFDGVRRWLPRWGSK